MSSVLKKADKLNLSLSLWPPGGADADIGLQEGLAHFYMTQNMGNLYFARVTQWMKKYIRCNFLNHTIVPFGAIWWDTFDP